MSSTRLGYVLGAALVIAGLYTPLVGLAYARWGQANWEIGYFAELSSTLASPFLGLCVIGFAAAMQGNRKLLIGMSAFLVVLGLFAAVGGGLVALNLPLVWKAASLAPSPDQRTGMKVITVKAVALCGLYASGSMVFALSMAKAAMHKHVRRVA
jgi:hypothetical protein